MRRRFWQFVHDRLERAWHWVYYHKLARPEDLPKISTKGWKYKFTYVCGKTGMTSDPGVTVIRDEN